MPVQVTLALTSVVDFVWRQIFLPAEDDNDSSLRIRIAAVSRDHNGNKLAPHIKLDLRCSGESLPVTTLRSAQVYWNLNGMCGVTCTTTIIKSTKHRQTVTNTHGTVTSQRRHLGIGVFSHF